MKKPKVFDINKISQILLDKIENGESLLLPDISSEWILVSIVEDWKIYIVHDSCHDNDEKNYVADRNTVIAMNADGLWTIIGRELPFKYAVKIAKGHV